LLEMCALMWQIKMFESIIIMCATNLKGRTYNLVTWAETIKP
jgi:hypothetical protein